MYLKMPNVPIDFTNQNKKHFKNGIYKGKPKISITSV